MNNSQKIKSFYNAAAKEYADAFINELEGKPFDRHLLERFAKENKDKGQMADLGCGPGQTTAYLKNCGVDNLIGIDISDKLIEQARSLNPTIEFEIGDMLKLDKKAGAFASIIAFYAIVHIDSSHLETFFVEARRVLKKAGQLLISFHIGDDIVQVEEFLGKKASGTFIFHQVENVCDLLEKTGFNLVDVMIRHPYKDKEYQSKRAYIISQK